MAKNIDFEAGHSPITGTLNAAYTALTVAAVGHETGLPPTWVMGASAVGAVGSAVAGGSREPKLSGESIALRAGAWLAGGGWVSYAISQNSIWSWGVIGPMLATACGFGTLAGALGAKKARDQKRAFEMTSALFRVKTGQDWSDRFARVAHVEGCEIVGVEQWTNRDGKPSDAGYTLEVKMPIGGSSWRNLASCTDELASDANLPEGCGVEVFAGKGRAYAIVKVSTMNALLETQNVPYDATPLDFEKPFDIGVMRDSSLAMVDMREFSAMLVGAKRTGKTNELLAIMTRLIRMPNLLIWVVDFNGGGVALQWLRAWNDLGKPGRPPIDWVASTPMEAEQMAMAAVRIAKARKIGYQQYMADRDTDLLPMSPEIPGIMIITDEGAEVYANPANRSVAEPMKEVLRIAGSSGVNQINCFLRATADVTGDTIVKSQSKVRIGMRMADEAEMAYLLGYKAGVRPEDMPDQGYGALSMDESSSASIFRGWRVLPSAIRWFVENTADLRRNDGLDDISLKAAGEVYTTRWADDRAGYIFTGSKTSVGAAPAIETPKAPEAASEGFLADRPAIDPDAAKANLHKAIEEEGVPIDNDPNDDEFDRVLSDAGVTDWDDPSTWPDGVRPEPPKPNESDNLRAVIFGLVKAMSPDGIQVKEIQDALARMYGEDSVPTRQTITRWLREDDRIHKPSGYSKYAVKPEEM
jgi:hypothetical protein